MTDNAAPRADRVAVVPVQNALLEAPISPGGIAVTDAATTNIMIHTKSRTLGREA